MLRLVRMLRNPPSRKDLLKVYFFGQGPPLRLKLRSYVPDSDLQELTSHTLFRMRYIVVAVRKDAHAHKAPGSSRSEVTHRESISAGIRLVDDREGQRMEGSAQWIGAGGAQVARIFVQKETRKKLSSLPGGTVGLFVAVDSAKCVGAIFPISWVVVWRIEHLETRTKRRKNHGGRAKSLMDVDLKLVFPRQAGPG